MAVMTKKRSKAQPTMLGRQEMIALLIQNGLLFEINRTILHPLGRSLQIQQNRETGRYDMAMLVDNPGVTFDEVTFRTGAAKLARFRTEEGDMARSERQELLGFTVQLKPNAKEQRRR